MITLTDIANARIRQGAMLSDSAIIIDLLDSYVKEGAYIRASEGEAYYGGDHDIKDHDFQTSEIVYTDTTNPETPSLDTYETFRNPNASDRRVQHKFLFNHIEQKVGYISGREPTISVDGAKADDNGGGNDLWRYQTELAKTTNARFSKILPEWERAASKYGVAWLHEYKDKTGALRQIVIGKLQGLPIYDTIHQQELVGFIYWYTVTENISGQEQIIKKVQWWTSANVTYWTESGSDGFVMDPDYQINPAPHYWEVIYGTGPDGVAQLEKSRTGKSWGRVPFVELANNPARLTDLQQYKDLIDAYDLISSTGTNNLLDFNEFYLAILGFGGDVANAIRKKLLVNKSVSATASTGSIEMKQAELDMQGRINWLKEIWSAIHFFGNAVDTNADRIGNAPSGVSLEFQYSLLDLKADLLITEAKLALTDHFWFVTEDLNRRNRTAYDSTLVNISFNKSRITNRLETVQMIVQSDNLVPERLLLQAHPLVDDADQAYKDLLEQRTQKLKEQRAMMPTYGKLPGGDSDAQDE